MKQWINSQDGMEFHKLAAIIIILISFFGIQPFSKKVSAENLSQNKAHLNPACCYPSPPRSASVSGVSDRYLFGVLNDDGNHFLDEWARGIRATNLELHWDKYETSEGVYNTQYINQLRALMFDLKSQGWYVQLVPGYQYVPEWVFQNYPDSYLSNQYGEIYAPDPAEANDLQMINAPFNPQARTLIANYISHLLSVGFPQDDPMYHFDSIRIGGGPQGELRYPSQDWNGHTNSFWAFDPIAQSPAVSGIPDDVVGWRPGIDPNPGSVGHGQLIVNAGFESTHEYYPVFGWSPDDEVKASIDQDLPHSGNYSLRVTIQSPHRIHQFVQVEPNTKYVVSGWMRSLENGNLARLFITQYDANSDLISGSTFVKLESASTAWGYEEDNLNTTAATRFLKVELDGDRPGSYYFDDLKLNRNGELDERSREINVPASFYDWYIHSLTEYQNWQIAEVRKYFAGQLDILYAGKGIQSRQIMGALTNDLQGNGWSEGLSSLYAGTDFQRHVLGLETKEIVALYVTGIDVESPDQVDDLSPFPGQWSGARWIAYLAESNGIPVWGENSGEDSAEKLWLSASRMHKNNFMGMMWGFEAELYANPNPNGYATIADYEQVIYFYNNLREIFIPFITNSGRVFSRIIHTFNCLHASADC